MTTGLWQRLHRQRVPLLWWTSRRTYLLFVLRELTSVAVVWFVVYLLLLVRAVGAGPGEYERFLDWSARPWMVAINTLALALAVLHTITWFMVTPQAMVLKVRGHRVPGLVLAGALYVAWFAVSAVILLLVLS